MPDTVELKVPKWPFFLADAIVLGLAYFIYAQGKGPLSHWEITALSIAVGAGALLGVVPFVLEYRALLKMIETSALQTATEKIQKLEVLAAQINGATNHWHTAQEQADKTATTAREISERMISETREFSQFMEKINEGEKATLRLEVEKLRRSENDWLQVLVHTLDHIYALSRAAERSGQASVIGQVGNFQNACRDVARRIGLTPVVAGADEAFDAKRHQWADGERPDSGAVINETVATGYTYQGKLIRPILVRLRDNSAAKALEGQPAADAQLVLESGQGS